jgi:tRNA-splicing ligase RtcB
MAVSTLSRANLRKIHDWLWEIPRGFRKDMRVPARVYASAEMLDELFEDTSLPQLVNVATLPGITRAALVMPDVHEGYGFPIGGVAAMRHPNGVISPGGIGYDINCGVRLLRSGLTYAEAQGNLASLGRELYRQVPSGVGHGGEVKLSDKDLDDVLTTGVEWTRGRGYAEAGDAEHLESSGRLPSADPAAVSAHAKNRGRDQLGTMGAGNHFVEVARVEQVFDEAVAKTFELFPDQLVVMIHCGSRGLGHQVATDYIRTMLRALPRYGLELPDRELACAPFSSPEGQSYFRAMASAANFAWANRQIITWKIRRGWRRVFGERGGQLTILYDVAHNIAKVEEHDVDGLPVKLVVHRKGATRAFGPGHPEVPATYRNVGQPVLIPGTMGTASYVLVGTERGMTESFGSCCHGAGRRMSRHAAKRQVRGRALRDELKKHGIHIQSGSLSGLAEEAPLAYKDVDRVVAVVAEAGLARRVARLTPVVVVKG